MPRECLNPPELYDVIAATGNHEVKALVLASMVPDVPYTVTPIHERVMALQGDEPVWKLHKNGPHEFCGTFAGVGLVAEETVGANASLAYRITDRGRKLALPLVGHLMDLSLTEEPSLLEFFGPTQTNSAEGVRPSERRIKLMDAMRQLNGEKTRSSDLAALMGSGIAHTGSIIDDLAATDIVSKESSGRGKPTVTFVAGAELADITLRHDVGSQLLFDVVAVLQKHFVDSPDIAVSNANIARQLIASRGYTDVPVELIRKVSRKTHYLANTRYALEPTREIAGETAREVTWATVGQIRVINKVMSIIDGIQAPDDDYLAQGRENVRVITSDPEMVKYLVAKARGASVGLKRGEDERREVQASLGRILNTTTPLSIRELQTLLLESGDNLDRVTIRNHLKGLAKIGGIAMDLTNEGEKYRKE